MKLNHILLTSDLSLESQRPFEGVTELAKDVGAKVTLLHVVLDVQVTPHGAPFAPAVSSPGLEEELEEAKVKLDDLRAAMGSDIEVGAEVISGPDTAKAIVGFAEHHGVDLIAISTHGRKGLRHLALGSVAEQVIRRSEIPVLSFHRTKKD